MFGACLTRLYEHIEISICSHLLRSDIDIFKNIDIRYIASICPPLLARVYCRGVRFGPKVVILALNGTKSGLILIKFQYILAIVRKMYWNLIWKSPRFVLFGPIYPTLGPTLRSLYLIASWLMTESRISVCSLWSQIRAISPIYIIDLYPIFPITIRSIINNLHL